MQQDMQTPQEMEHHQNQDLNNYYHQMPSHTIHHLPNDQTNIPQPYIYAEHDAAMHPNVLQDQYDHQQTMYYNQSCNSIVSWGYHASQNEAPWQSVFWINCCARIDNKYGVDDELPKKAMVGLNKYFFMWIHCRVSCKAH